MNKLSFLKGMSGRIVTLVNLVSNGDMASTSGWQHLTTYSTEAIDGDYLKSTRYNTRPYVGTTSTWNIASGHKVYFAAKALGSKSGTMYLMIYGTFGSTNISVQGCSLTTGVQSFSFVDTLSGAGNGLAFDGYSFTTSGNYIMVDKALVIDLTACFGSGSEPSKAQMDSLLATAQFTDSWFDGTKVAIYNW